MAGDAGAAATAADGQAQQEAQQAPQFDPAAIESRFEQLAQGQEESRQLLQGLMGQLTPQEAEQSQEPDPIDLSEFLDPAVGQDAEAINQQLNQLLDQRVQHGVQQALAQLQPELEQMREFRSDVEMERLVSEFPVLGENPELAQQVFQAAGALAQANGNPALAQQPWFLRQTTLAAIGARAMQDEAQQDPAAADGGAATLEGAAGAVPGGGSGGMTGQQIIGARRKVTPF